VLPNKKILQAGTDLALYALERSLLPVNSECKTRAGYYRREKNLQFIKMLKGVKLYKNVKIAYRKKKLARAKKSYKPFVISKNFPRGDTFCASTGTSKTFPRVQYRSLLASKVALPLRPFVRFFSSFRGRPPLNRK
jgi:hypothetical protein